MLTSLFRGRETRPGAKAPGTGYRSRPTLTTLEDRVVPYNLSGLYWADPNVTASFMPDGTSVTSTATSTLFAEMGAVASTDVWQREFARALQTWANYSPLNFRIVPDDGSPRNTWGLIQGDPRFGDIRFGAQPLGMALASTYYPSPKGSTQGGTGPGEVFLNSDDAFRIGSTYDLYSVLVHEAGHALGLGHSDSGTVMYGTYHGVVAGLTADDIAGIRAIYGTRQHDAYDAAGSNSAIGTATALALNSGGVNFRADLTGQADVDYYRVVASGSSLTVSVDARSTSLLAPRVLVHDAAGTLLGSAGAAYGQVATLDLTGLTAGQSYYLVADGATTDVFGMGAYSLDARFGGGSTVTGPAAPSGLTATAASSSQVNLAWADNSTDEDGFRVERSTDGITFTPAGTAGSNATGYSVTGLTADTTYYFRVRAYNSGGDSAWSNTAQATTPAAPPPSTLPPDRFEANESATAARDLGKFNSTSQSALTVHSVADVDWLVFTVNSSGTFKVSITFKHAAGNLDLYVYDAQQRLLAGGVTAADNEAVTLALTGGQRYYLKVGSPNGGVNSYDLAVAKLSGKTGGGGNYLLRDPGLGSQESGTGTAADFTPRGCGCPACAAVAAPTSVIGDGAGEGRTRGPAVVQFAPAEARPGQPGLPGRTADTPAVVRSPALRLLAELDLTVWDGPGA